MQIIPGWRRTSRSLDLPARLVPEPWSSGMWLQRLSACVSTEGSGGMMVVEQQKVQQQSYQRTDGGMTGHLSVFRCCFLPSETCSGPCKSRINVIFVSLMLHIFCCFKTSLNLIRKKRAEKQLHSCCHLLSATSPHKIIKLFGSRKFY